LEAEWIFFDFNRASREPAEGLVLRRFFGTFIAPAISSAMRSMAISRFLDSNDDLALGRDAVGKARLHPPARLSCQERELAQGEAGNHLGRHLVHVLAAGPSCPREGERAAAADQLRQLVCRHAEASFPGGSPIRIVKVVPSPTFETTSIVHPWLSTMVFTVVRPRPKPCSRRELVPR
jgi:hypothetical protein